MLKGTIRPKLSGRLFEIADFLKSCLVHFHRNAHETVVALIEALVLSGNTKFQKLSGHLPVGDRADARERRLERYINMFKVNMEALWLSWFRLVVDRHIGDTGPVYLAMDWTEEGSIMSLSVDLLVEGRGIPLWRRSYLKDGNGEGKKIEIEQAAMAAISQAINDPARIILLADRAFGNARMISDCQKYGFHYIFRLRGNIWVESFNPHFNGYVEALHFNCSKATRIDDARLLYEKTLTTNVIFIPGRPTRRKGNPENWLLATNLPDEAKVIGETYSHRWGIECEFDDSKNELNYRKPKWRTPQAVDRIFFLQAVVIELCVSAGSSEREEIPMRNCCSWESEQRCVKRRNKKVRVISLFLAGLMILRLAKKKLADLLYPHPGGRCLLFR